MQKKWISILFFFATSACITPSGSISTPAAPNTSTYPSVSIVNTVSSPSFFPSGGSYSSTQSVVLFNSTLGASVYYTTDGTNPTCSFGTLYTAAISVNSNTQLSAIACKANLIPSPVIKATYNINLPTPIPLAKPISSPTQSKPAPTLSPNPTASPLATPEPTATPVDMALIPSGSFAMGNIGGSDTYNWYAPQHSVSVSAFSIDKNLVTIELWQQVYTWAATHGYDIEDTGYSFGAKNPVNTVSWYSAVKWCNARSEMELLNPVYFTDASQTTVYRSGIINLDNTFVAWNNNGYRLPTEAEWEKAARGGISGLRYPWGDSISQKDARYSSAWVLPDHDLGPNNTIQVSTTKVGSFNYNGYGLFDMIGNVDEWCWDYYSTTYYSSSPSSDPKGPSPSRYHVSRGGSWGNYSAEMSSAQRNFGPATGKNPYLGFRTVRGH